MDTIEALFSAFDGPAKLGAIVGVTTEHAAAMKRRRSIPPLYWPKLVAHAATNGIAGVTHESLTVLHIREREARARDRAHAEVAA
jgi:hypothetical protein